MLAKYLECSTYCAKFFTCITSYNPHNNPKHDPCFIGTEV